MRRLHKQLEFIERRSGNGSWKGDDDQEFSCEKLSEGWTVYELYVEQMRYILMNQYVLVWPKCFWNVNYYMDYYIKS